MSRKLKFFFAWFVPIATALDIAISYWFFSQVGFDGHEANKMIVWLVNKLGLELALLVVAALVGLLVSLVLVFWEYRLARYYGIFMIATRMFVLPYNFYCAFVLYDVLYLGG